MKVKEYDINQLISAEYNPRQLSQRQYQNLRNSIQRFGLVDPILINVNKDRKNIIIGGHQRVNIAKVLEIKKVPCVELDLTLEQERELNIRLNQNTGDWDFDVLADNFDLDELMEFGFEEKDLKLDLFEVEEEGLTDDDDIPEDVESVCKLGDLWKLGNHRLLCGDSTKKENVDLLLDGNKADMVFTDPPYGVSASGGRSQTVKKNNIKKIENDDLRGEKLLNFLIKAISIIPLKNNCSFYICYDQKTQVEFISAIKNKWNFKRTLIWNKNVFGLSGKKGYRPKYELIAFGFNGDEYNWYGDNSQADVIDVPRPKRIGNHPTTKPIELIKTALKNSSKKNDLILDSFLGSGSTLIACEKTNRVCYGMELDEHYCDVIINRWEQYTGKKAELING
jgi:DNA modification methylase